MKAWMKASFRGIGLDIIPYTSNPCEQVITLQPAQPAQGAVLLSWILEPFLVQPDEPMPNSHTQYWECAQIAKTFLELGYAVDVIDSHNETFHPRKPYAFFIGHRTNFDRLAGLLHGGCVKIAHLDTAHWLFHNHANYRRKFELHQRRGVILKEWNRLIQPNRAIENADYAVTYGNQFTVETYRYAQTPLFRVPISSCAVFPWPEQKSYAAGRSQFLWFGSGGFVHKGLDVVLEAFAAMPEYHLYVCGPLHHEKEFVNVFSTELYETPNIHTVGWVDVDGPAFKELAAKCVGVVYPSCSEGQAGSVISCIHAGLIPIVSYESGVDVEGFGVVLQDDAINTIQEAVRMVANLPDHQLQRMARQAWEFARAHHTRERFADEYGKVVQTVMEQRGLLRIKQGSLSRFPHEISIGVQSGSVYSMD